MVEICLRDDREDSLLVDLGAIFRLMGARENQLIRMVVVPSAFVWVFAGLRMSAPYALIGAIVAEMIASNRGLGWLVQNSAAQFNTAAASSNATSGSSRTSCLRTAQPSRPIAQIRAR